MDCGEEAILRLLQFSDCCRVMRLDAEVSDVKHDDTRVLRDIERVDTNSALDISEDRVPYIKSATVGAFWNSCTRSCNGSETAWSP